MSSDNDSNVTRTHKLIKLREQNSSEAEKIRDKFDLSPLACRILAARSFQVDETLQNFLKPSLKDGLPDPKELKNLEAGCGLVREIVENDGKIGICCDFDVDGISSGSLLFSFFQSAGIESKVFVPDRFVDGYGLNNGIVEAVADEGCKLLITLDYGTTNHVELEHAKSLGLKTIVVDHHHVDGDGPPADVFINPQQKGCGFADKILCAAGLTWYFAIGLRKVLKKAEGVDLRDLLDLACLGTICDMVPLIGVNRVIAAKGLEKLTTTKRPGLIALKNVIGIYGDVTGTHVGFGIGPRINAAGRMVNAEMVVDLLTTDKTKHAAILAKKLNKLNLQRQDTELAVKEKAIKKVQERGELPAGIVVWDDNFHTGVIGIVAQRMVEMYYRPAAVLGADNDIYKGSVRGIKDFNVVHALAAVGEHLIKFGGHEGAGGFSIKPENLEAFAEGFELECKKRLAKIDSDPYANADTTAEVTEIDEAAIDELLSLSPFGIGNPAPQVLIEKLEVTRVEVLKGAHLKAILSDGRRYVAGLMWRHKEHPELKEGAVVDVVCRPGINDFMGQREVQLTLQAVRSSGSG